MKSFPRIVSQYLEKWEMIKMSSKMAVIIKDGIHGFPFMIICKSNFILICIARK